ncbi:JmjC domain-containing protein [Mycobacterium sp. E3339]|uniref:JmjC domain-containing protein n=1 Tax=Mycobacterium sp. E3339 TaxID=1834146 RepID=UPI0007FD01F1|nr:cupin domain-containing protein [Mycobacterium sp. E3339]OBG69759.1 hypothetical protein A5702_11725 [Mycobacterium sp. E3339]
MTEFEHLIAPLTSHDIAASVAAGVPLFRPGDASSFQTVFSRDLFDSIARRMDDVRATYPSADRRSMTPGQRIDPCDISAHYEAGATICLTAVNRACPRLQRLADSCKHSLGWSGIVDCRAYLSGDGSGYTPHFDTKDVITLQIEGSKQWQVANAPAVRNPISNAGQFPDGIYRYFRDDAELRPWEQFDQPDFPNGSTTYTLDTGDALVVPAGVWHNVRADGPSLSIAIALNHLAPGNTLAIILSTLARELMADSEWRGTPPMAPTTGSDESFGALYGIDEFFVERLRSLRACIDRTLEDRGALIAAWARHLRLDP